MLLLSVSVTLATCLHFCRADLLYDMDLTNPSPTVTAQAFTIDAETHPIWPAIINEYTACYWMKAGIGQHYVFEISLSETQAIKVGMSVNTTLVELFFANVIKAFVNPPFKPNVWNHVCQTWTNVDGSGLIYFNGQVAFNFTGVAIGEVILMNQSYMILGNPFGLFGTYYDGSFQGRISELHFWNKVLSADEVGAVSSCAKDVHGNVLDWHNIGWTMTSRAVIRPTTLPCLVDRELREDIAVDFMEDELEYDYLEELYDYYYNYDDEYDYSLEDDLYYAEKEAAIEDDLIEMKEEIVADVLDIIKGDENAAVETYRNPMSSQGADGINNVVNIVYPPKY